MGKLFTIDQRLCSENYDQRDYQDDYLTNPIVMFNAVISGLRPIGFCIVVLDDMCIMSEDAKDANIVFSSFSIDPLPNDEMIFFIGFGNKGRICDHFNIDNLLATYQSFSNAVGHNLLSEEDEMWLKLRSDCELAEFITPDIYLLEKEGIRGLVLLDLLLGLPLESTIAKIAGGFIDMKPLKSLLRLDFDEFSFTRMDPSRFSFDLTNLVEFKDFLDVLKCYC